MNDGRGSGRLADLRAIGVAAEPEAIVCLNDVPSIYSNPEGLLKYVSAILNPVSFFVYSGYVVIHSHVNFNRKSSVRLGGCFLLSF